jgi:hypothetical protein
VSASFRILKSLNLVYVRYEGRIRIRESMDLFASYAQHPDCRPGQKQIVDLSAVTDYERDYTAMMEMQAMKTDVFLAEGNQPIILYFAPTQLSQKLARLIIKSWEPFSAVVPLIIEDEAEALQIIGIEEKSIAGMLSATA